MPIASSQEQPNPSATSIQTEYSGPEGARYLSENGLIPRRAPIRSSGYELWRRCPFAFMLQYRYGIHPSGGTSPALLFGRFFHRYLEGCLLNLGDDAHAEFLQADFTQCLQEEIGLLRTQGATGDELEQKTQELTNSATTAYTWAEAGWSISPIPGISHKYRVALVEPLIHYRLPSQGNRAACDVVARPDAILYDKERNEVWIVDFKTSFQTPHVRSATCPWEFQTNLYRNVVDTVIKKGHLEGEDNCDIPRDARVAGFIHWILQKPTIRISKRTAKAKGDAAARSEYLDRCVDWFKGEGEFKHLSFSRAANEDPINCSFVRFFPSHHDRIFEQQLDEFRTACTRPNPCPLDYPRSSDYIRGDMRRSLHPLTPFYVRPIPEWPAMISSGIFSLNFRDEDVDPDISTEE